MAALPVSRRGVLGGIAVGALVVSIGAFAPLTALAGGGATGTFKNIDDETGKAKAKIQITERGGKLNGKILELINPTGDGICHKCTGAKKDQPIEGMTIMWGLEKVSDTRWDGGYILDPKKGKTYRCRVDVLDGGKTLKVRGYVGVSMLGRTQKWFRVD